MTNVLVTGFTPFDGRAVNASWIAARSLADQPGTTTFEIPVTWGAPGDLLPSVVEDTTADVVISMGEGRIGWFDIETVARNQRNERPDNDTTLPEGAPIFAEGPASISATIDAQGLQRRLVAGGAPARISHDAGAFLCEELLYTLEMMKTKDTRLQKVVFVHLPPFGTQLMFAGERTTCDESLLQRFAMLLYEAVLSL